MDTLAIAADALGTILEPFRLAILFGGVLIGLALGIIPGLGGIVGLAILIPFTYSLDPHSAFALLIGVSAVTTVSDVIPAVLFGVPGTVASAATVLDGYPMARQGLAGRALGACYASSLLGGVFGAVLLGVSIPVLRPVMLYIGSPELFAFCVFGLATVAGLSGTAPFRGLAAACLGLMISMIGTSPQTGTMRWTFDSLYLWDGIPIVPITLGLFALPELADLVIHRSRIASAGGDTGFSLAGQREGIRQALGHWWLVLRCSWLGAALGAVPGMGSAVIDWVAYGYAVRSAKNPENFGKGDIRGVIASESAANAKEGGALVPTIAFGVPGSASMALLLSAFLMHGLVPGPEMLTRHLDITYTIIWSLVVAHMLAAVICLFASGQLARIVHVRYGVLVPVVLSIAFVGAFQGSSSWGDLWTLLIMGVVGFLMKALGWPRPPLILGIVLGAIFERYMFISVQRYDAAWLLKPSVVVILAVALLVLYKPLKSSMREPLRSLFGLRRGGASFRPPLAFHLALFGLVAFAIFRATGWPANAAIVPLTAAWLGFAFIGLDFVLELYRPRSRLAEEVAARTGQTGFAPARDEEGRENELVLTRGGQYFAWLFAFLAACLLIGFLPGIFVFIIAFMRIEGRERLRLAVPLALLTVAALWGLFDRIFSVAWPVSHLGQAFPALRALTGGLI